jgi:hypothetical protein
LFSPSAMTEMLDSLPYYDNDLETFPELQALLDKELTREPKPPAALHPNVPAPFEPFSKHPLLQAELARVDSRQPLSAIDNLRYQLPTPTTDGASVDEWKAALQNAYAQLEHQRLRQINLTLLQTYGTNAWRIHNYLQEADAVQAEKFLEQYKERVVDLNRERKNFQTNIGKQLTSLETRWTELISSILQIEMANIAVDGEIDELNKRERELSEALGS